LIEKYNKNWSLIAVALFFSILLVVPEFVQTALASSSSNYKLDYTSLTEDSPLASSSNYKLDAGITHIEHIAQSNSYELTAVSDFPICGNGILETGEACDSTNFGGKFCSDYGFSQGNLACSNNCSSVITSSCINSGGGAVFFPPISDETDDSSKTSTATNPPNSGSTSDATDNTDQTDNDVEPPFSIPSSYPPKPLDIVVDVTDTDDHTPLILAKVRPNSSYEIEFKDFASGETILTDSVLSDEKGLILYEPSFDLRDGRYLITISALDSDFKIYYNYRILSADYKYISINSFYLNKDLPQIFGRIVGLGSIIYTDKAFVHGLAEPHSRIIAYIDDRTHSLRTVSNSDGEFSISLPSNLTLGYHIIKIMQILPNGFRGKNLTYGFTLIKAVDTPPSPDSSNDGDGLEVLFILLGTMGLSVSVMTSIFFIKK